MKINFFEQDLKENQEHFDFKDSKINLHTERCEDKSSIEKLTKSPYSQNLKKQFVQLNKKSDHQSSFIHRQDQSIKNSDSIQQDHIVKISNFPERCYINRFVEYKIPNKLKNQKIQKNKKLHDSIIHDENIDNSTSIIIRQKSYLRLSPDNKALSGTQQVKQNGQTTLLPPINANTTFEINRCNRYEYKQTQNDNKREQELINNAFVIKNLIKKSNTINEKLIQSINRTYLQQSKSINPMINNKSNNNINNNQNNNKISDQTALSKQAKRIQELNKSYNCFSQDFIDSKTVPVRKAKQLSLHRNNQSFTMADIVKNQTFRQMYNNQKTEANTLDNSYINILINKDLIN